MGFFFFFKVVDSSVFRCFWQLEEFSFFLFWNLLMLPHVLTESVLIVGEEVAFAADALVVDLVDVGGQPLRAGRFVVAQDAQVGFDVGV